MAKEPKQGVGREKYSEVVARLQVVVEELEGGKLSLEDSLDKFAEGVQLVKRGEQLLGEAEKRIEQLLSEDGQTAPLDVSAPPAPARSSSKQPPRRPEPPPESFGPPPPGMDEDEGDVPF